MTLQVRYRPFRDKEFLGFEIQLVDYAIV
ncbi:unnamed protein product [Spodoptera littoralis]|uniref:Uncharacterized protein n=1 Tax=Spodoptera littoralis TaxID=7109 RepID=A0A9P0I4N6_SPOLI|nr:unnamed protein product [Spodoptera littoralis]CAH1641044.1 unnamed protein product [Spodoptera littoralis]